MTHVLVTNDFPPKTGGIQNYLWELWRRLPPESFAVYTTPYRGDEAFDATQAYRIERAPEFWLLPHFHLRRRIERLVAEIGAGMVVFDPALPVGAVGPQLTVPYAVILHGAEVVVPARLPGSRQLLNRTVGQAALVISAGTYAGNEAEQALGRPLPRVFVPPGVDVDRFRPLPADERRAARRRLGLPEDAPVVLGVSRLVPRKGFDTVIEAAARLGDRHPDAVVVIAGTGRDRSRLERVAASGGATVRFLGRVPDEDLAPLYGCADVFAMMCRSRWGGLEQEGFGIVFLEAAAAGVPQLAGASGGAADAVADGETGVVVDPGNDVGATTAALARLLGDEGLRRRMGRAARQRAVREFSYDILTARLEAALEPWSGRERRNRHDVR